MGCHPSHWRTPWFFRGVGWNHQPDNYCLCKWIYCGLLPNNRWLDISSRGLWTTFNTHEPGGSLSLLPVEQRGPAQPVSMRLRRLLRWPYSIHKLWYSLDIYIYIDVYIYIYKSIVLFVSVTLSILVDLTFFVWLICIFFTLAMFLSLSLHIYIYIHIHKCIYTHHTYICATGRRMDAIHPFFWGVHQFYIPHPPYLFGFVWKCRENPKKPNGVADHDPYEQWLFHWGYTPFSDIPI